MKLIIAIIRDFKVPEVIDAVEQDPAFPGMTVLDCRGFGREKSRPHRHEPGEELNDFVDRKAVLVAAPAELADGIARRIEQLAHTGQPGDGKVFVLPLSAAIRIATGERDEDALR
jgi:nitrogen regulatory protein P-II 1